MLLLRSGAMRPRGLMSTKFASQPDRGFNSHQRMAAMAMKKKKKKKKAAKKEKM
jgi:hypothetical protein